MIKTIIFDLDDTLHDRSETLKEFVKRFYRAFAERIVDTDVVAFERIFFRFDEKGYKPRELFFKEVLQEMKWTCAPAVEECIAYWKDVFPSCAVPMSGLRDILDFCKSRNLKIGIITNGDTKFQNTKIDTLGIREYIDSIIISEEVGVEKPEAEIYTLALSKLGAVAEETIFVGDNPILDVIGPKKAGMKAIWLSQGRLWSEAREKPDFIIEKLRDLMLVRF